MPNGHGEVRAGDEHARHVADGTGRLGLGPDHEPGRVAQEHDRDVERVAQLQEPGRLVGRGRVDRAAEMRRVVGDDADRPALDPRQRGDHASPNPRRSSSTEPVSHSASMTVRTSYARTRFSGTRWRSVRWSAHSHARRTARRKYERYCLATRDRLGLVRHDDVDDAVRAPARRPARWRSVRTRRARHPRSSPGRPCRCSSLRWR